MINVKKRTSPKRIIVIFALVTCVVTVIAFFVRHAFFQKAPNTHLTGIVQLNNGRPVRGGMIRLDFGNSRVASTGIDSKGNFYFGHLPEGKARVAIETEFVGRIRPPEIHPMGREKYAEILATIPGGKDEPKRVPILDKYSDPATSGLSVEIKVGKNHSVVVVRGK